MATTKYLLFAKEQSVAPIPKRILFSIERLPAKLNVLLTTLEVLQGLANAGIDPDSAPSDLSDCIGDVWGALNDIAGFFIPYRTVRQWCIIKGEAYYADACTAFGLNDDMPVEWK